MKVLRRLALIIILVLLAGAGATPAFAGEYPVYACDPDHGDVNRSWVGYTGGGGTVVEVHCPTLGQNPWQQGLVVRRVSGASTSYGGFARLTFTPPAGAGLSRITYSHRFCGWGGFNAGLINAGGTWLHYSDPSSCGTMLASPYTLALSGTPWLSLLLYCVRDSCPAGADSAGYAAMRSATVWVADSTKPSVAITGGTVLGGQWKRGTLSLTYRASDNTGISNVNVSAGSVILDQQGAACDSTRSAPCPNRASSLGVDTTALRNGNQPLVVGAVDAAGNRSTATVRVSVDNIAPSAPLHLTAAGGDGWRQSNSFALRWTNPHQADAPIAAAEYAVCPGERAPSDWTGCSFGERATTDVSALDGISVPRAGEWGVRVWLRDAAGNESRDTAQSVLVRLDNTSPSVAFGAVDSGDPTRIDIRASDSMSPIAEGEAEIRREGDAGWLPITTTATSAGFVAHLDDEHLTDGAYQLRALVADSAGNERSTTLDLSGHAAIRRVPARIDTRLVVGQPRRGVHRLATHPTIGYRQAIVLRGQLTTLGANPVVHADIEAWAQPVGSGGAARRVALVKTDRHGRFTFKASRGPSRVLRFRYPGTRLVRARTARVDVHVRGRTTLRTNRREVVNGEDIKLSGRVLGGQLPRVGKLVQLQAFSRGKWLTFATPRADAVTGRWSYGYRFTSTRGTVRYRFRARVPRESGFPYSSGTSRYVYVTVRGL
jgi:hypothetical protein